ncbi:hypothetical protein [Flavilitoribacter nigricans]|uniref:T9SS type A sorting domain-containing protein n=1 Tax=Flavilitoribacter nigricans (strain ATCC 23147 / DSM 23189 / NBRC 102662 / NCIMB 1420 / SS-2) TaxID=1122177 RepID=A0A2D0N653_FLAN2|nr:hypothetical protein [Flavilitoribacter nigricans]PHN03253.1 hypothetical protein CRP01_28070 [Flavilitoribacter nigricans DSM 23189 = NBRC 102662]
MNIFKSFFLIALMAISFSLHANDGKPESNFNLQTKIVNDNAMVYQVMNLQKMHTTVSITSIDEKTTFYRAFVRNHNGYSTKVHLENLAGGRYIFEVRQGATTKKQIILVKDRQIFLSNISE